MAEEPVPALQKRPVESANPLPTEARDADVTPSWMSLSMRRSTLQAEKQATNWMEKSGMGETLASSTEPLYVCAAHAISGLQMDKDECWLQLNAVTP